MRRPFAIFLSIVLGLVLVGIWLYIVDIREVFIIFRSVKIAFIFPLAITFVLTYFFRSLRWKIILSPVEQITAFESFKLCMANYFINFLIPIHAGEVAKSFLLKKMKKTPISKSLLPTYIDKITDLLTVFLLLAVTPFLGPRIDSLIYLISGILFIIFFIFIISLISVVRKKGAALAFVEKIFFFLPRKLKIKFNNFFSLFVESVTSLPRLSNRLLEIIGLTLLALLCHCFFLWLFFYSFGINLPAISAFVGYLLLSASFILPAPPGFSGSLELTMLFIFNYLFGYDKNIVSAVTASSHVFTAILFSLLGLLSIGLIGTKLSAVFKLELDEKMAEEGLKASD